MSTEIFYNALFFDPLYHNQLSWGIIITPVKGAWRKPETICPMHVTKINDQP
jgi:hypothetical protein